MPVGICYKVTVHSIKVLGLFFLMLVQGSCMLKLVLSLHDIKKIFVRCKCIPGCVRLEMAGYLSSEECEIAMQYTSVRTDPV